MKLRALLAFLFLCSSLPLHAEIIELVIPVVVRAPSASGTDWRTDLSITNATPMPSRVNIAYYSSGQRQDEVRVVRAHSSITIPDIVGFFGHERGSGILRIESQLPFVTARARIYRIGLEKGDVGQIVPPGSGSASPAALSSVASAPARGSRSTSGWPTRTRRAPRRC
ncbi:MAG TPA: hypothetical protein VF618_13915 [Thermoanaerobaculia bacterium]